MKKSLISIAFGAIPFLAGCSATGYTTETENQTSAPVNNISNLGTGTITHSDVPVNYETLTLAATPYEIEKATRRSPDEEDFILRPNTDSILWTNRSNQRSWLTSNDIMVPRRLYVRQLDEQGKERLDPQGIPIVGPAREVEFDTTGAYALRAEINQPPLRELSIDEVTERLAQYNIQTKIIRGRPYAVAIKMDKPTGVVTQTLLIRTGEDDVDLGVKIRDGTVILRSPNDIYELVRIRDRDYKSRTEYTNLGSEKSPTPEIRAVR